LALVGELAWLANLIRQTCVGQTGIGELALSERSLTRVSIQCNTKNKAHQQKALDKYKIIFSEK